mgnify:FL=1
MKKHPASEVFDCFCGHEWVRVRQKNKLSLLEYAVYQCPMCFRRHQIRIGSSGLRYGLRCMTNTWSDGWVPSKEYNMDDIIRRVATTHYFNVKVLGNALANKMLEKAVGDYWNEVKGHWKSGSRPEWFSQ